VSDDGLIRGFRYLAWLARDVPKYDCTEKMPLSEWESMTMEERAEFLWHDPRG
jgi:hypothetical protein